MEKRIEKFGIQILLNQIKFQDNKYSSIENIRVFIKRLRRKWLIAQRYKFDFPEQQLFGKFDTFVRRLVKLIDIFQISINYKLWLNTTQKVWNNQQLDSIKSKEFKVKIIFCQIQTVINLIQLC
ncbi:unnamed protein product [Paramecium octaurelia]|uniref:Uncharacterized protein n=1 Tax=Paramecium octaurelia TaxID=43137 RepID=A0A8S1V970_PAROT|nr:unnamed protein product [Paramecium octaurelia]